MKQILLRVTSMFAKIGFAKFAQPPRRYLLGPRKIFLRQNALNPDVDGKRAQTFVGK
jgi:hypothetical protein